MQNVIAILLVLACAAYVAWQLLRTVKSGDGKAGACCSHGCGDHSATTTEARFPREQFVPSDTLRRRSTLRQ